MQGFRGLFAGGGYGALVGASSMFFGGLLVAGEFIVSGDFDDAFNALAAATFAGGLVASIVGSVIGAIVGFILGSELRRHHRHRFDGRPRSRPRDLIGNRAAGRTA